MPKRNSACQREWGRFRFTNSAGKVLGSKLGGAVSEAFTDTFGASGPMSKVAGALDDAMAEVASSDGALGALGETGAGALGKIAAAAPIAGAAVAAIGGVAIAAAGDFDSAGATIEAAVGADTAAAERLKGVGETLYTDGWGQSMTDLTGSLVTAREVLGDLSETDMTYAVEGAMTLEQVYGSDLSETLRGTRVLMDRFGLSAQEATDLMVAGTQRGLDYTGELGDNLSEYAGRWADAGIEASEYFSLLEAGADNGAYSLDKVGDFLNEFLTSLTDGRMEEGIGAFSEATQETFESFKDGGADAQDVLNAVVGELAGMPDEYKRAQVASELWSSLGEDNAMSMITALSGVDDTFTDVAGAAQDASDSLSDSLGGRMTTALHKWQAVLEPVGSVAVDVFLGAADVAGGLADAVGALVGGFTDAAERQELLASATMTFDDIMAEASDGARELGGALGSVSADSEGVMMSLADGGERAVESIADLKAQEGMLDTYTDTISRLAGQSDLTASEQMELQQAVEGYNSITGESVEVTDAAAGKLSESTDKIMANADAWRENAEAQAYQSIATEYLEEQIRAENELKVAKQELADAQAHLAEVNSDPSAYSTTEIYEAGKAVKDAQAKVEDLGVSAESAQRNFETFSSAASIAASGLDASIKSALQGLPASMQEAGLNIASSLSAGISSGSLSVEAAASFISDSVGGTVAQLPPEMQSSGLSAAQALADAISAGSISVDQASDILKAAANGDLPSLSPELRSIGGDAVQNLADAMGVTGSVSASSASLDAAAKSGVSGTPGAMGSTGSQASSRFAAGVGSASGATSASASALSSSAKSGVSGAPSSLSSVGSLASSGFASGIGSAVGTVRGNASSLASAARGMSNVGDMYGSGSHLGQNFASGISSAWSAVKNAASSLASAAASVLGFSVPDDGPWSGSEKGGATSGFHLGQNFAKGMRLAVPDVERASRELADAAYIGASGGLQGLQGRAVPPYTPSVGGDTDALLRQVVALLGDIYGAIPEGMDGRSFGRAVRKAVAYGY